MTVRDLMRRLVEFNPDAEVEVVVNDFLRSTNFSITFGAFEPETTQEKTRKVSIYLVEDYDYHYEDCCDCGME